METEVQFASNAEYENWLAENKDKVQEYVKQNDLDFKNMQIPARMYNVLRINGKKFMSDIIFLSNDEINNFSITDKPTVIGIRMLKKEYWRDHKADIIDFVTGTVKVKENAPENTPENIAENAPENAPDKANEEIAQTEQQILAEKISSGKQLKKIDAFLYNPLKKMKMIEFIKRKKVEIESLSFSRRSYNVLKRLGINYMHQAFEYYPDGFYSIRNIGAISLNEICGIIEKYVSDNYEQIIAYMNDENFVFEEPKIISIVDETDPFKLTILQLLKHPVFKDKAMQYLSVNDIPIKQIGLSNKSANKLSRYGFLSLCDILKVYPDDLISIKNLGRVSVMDIKTHVDHLLSKINNAVSVYCAGDESHLYSDEFMIEKILSCFDKVKFEGLSFKQIREVFPDDFNEARIKKSIGGLLADKKLEYVDFRLYRVYPSFFTILEESSLDLEIKDILRKKLNGMTLEAIGAGYGVTRERIRQKFDKAFKKIKQSIYEKYGLTHFDEDYYGYLFTNYEVIKEIWLDFIGVPIKVFNYLDSSYSKGKKTITDALSDPKIALILKFKIQDYLNRNKILINGKFVEKNRTDIENFVLSNFVLNELSYDEFVQLYNDILEKNGVEFDDKIYINEDVRRTRVNRLAESMYCLWKQGEKFRYYDIAVHDYEELLNAINLKSFVNVEISTLKLFNEHPDIMSKYDIRDHYELHNLLKKIVDCSKYNDMVFHRQPTIKFGTFDRDQIVYDLVVAFSPVTADELSDYLLSEYGFEKGTTQANFFSSVKKYYHKGVYNIEFKRIPNDRIETLKANLPDEFNYISDIKTLYKKLFENADTEEINHRSLKELGFTVYNSYVLKTYSSLESYFRDVVNANDVFSVTELNKRYDFNNVLSSVYYDMRKNFDVFIFEKGQCINLRRLEKLGITKDDVKEYCDNVYDQIEENQYFTIHWLRELGIETKLETLGFDDIFLGEILAVSTKFLHTRMFGEVILYKGHDVSTISKKSFILSMLSDYDSVEIEQFKDDFFDTYGIKFPDKYEITKAIADTNYYYDEIMDKVYKDKNIYYMEFDEPEFED